MKRPAAAKALALVLAMLLATGCASTGRSNVAKALFDFGPPAERLGVAGALPEIGLEVRAPSWFDTPSIAYRLAYANAAELRSYTESRWAGPPAQLVAQRWRQRLGMPSVAMGRCTLLVTLEEFSHVFNAPQASRGILRGVAVLVDRRGQPLGRTAVSSETVASANDAGGAVGALSAAADQAAESLGAWLADPGQGAALKACR